MNIKHAPSGDPVAKLHRMSQKNKTNPQVRRPSPGGQFLTLQPSVFQERTYQPAPPDDRHGAAIVFLWISGILALGVGGYIGHDVTPMGENKIIHTIIGILCGVIFSGVCVALGWLVIFLNDIANSLEIVRTNSDKDVVRVLGRIDRRIGDSADMILRAVNANNIHYNGNIDGR